MGCRCEDLGSTENTGTEAAAMGLDHPFNGTHVHQHPSYGSQGGDVTHEHEHSHAHDGSHDHHGVASKKAAAGPRVVARFGAASDKLGAIVPLTAAAADGIEPIASWHAVLTVEGLRTTDHRAIAPGALTWRPLPIPLMWQMENWGDHMSSVLVGKIDTISRDDTTGHINATGTWDLDGPNGAEAARLSAAGLLRWVSVDLEVLQSELVEIGAPEPDLFDLLFWSQTAAGEPLEYDWYEEFTEARIMGATMLPFPAFPQAVIAPTTVALPDVPPMKEVATVQPGLIACALPDMPPKGWFEDPALTAPTPLTITDEGRVFGHVACWGTCHTGFTDVCICPPRSTSGYAYAMAGGHVHTDDGDVRVGHLTMNAGHADLSADHRTAAAHYDNTATAFADVRFGEDDHGIWCAGVLRPDVSEIDVRRARASSLSGDWRDIGGSLELVACLAVNVPGFPITSAAELRRAALTASGELRALVAAGRVERDPLRPVRDALSVLDRRLRIVEGVQAPLIQRAKDELLTAVNSR